jgi:N-formylglutamate amidohydrolase
LKLNPLPPPIVHAPRGKLPVLLSVPHSGREYPHWLIALARQGPASLAALEDPLVDRLVSRALAKGAGGVIAQAPRAAIDCNRAEDEIDPAIIHGHGRARPSPRARGGLGIVPSRTAAHGHLWRNAIASEDLQLRLEQAYRPYHRALELHLSSLFARHGCALLIDCHSMPSSKGSPQIVYGDRFGRSAAPWLMSEAIAVASEAGFTSAANDPFAGGHILDRHGSPQNGVHAIQVEVDRSCYLDSIGKPGGRFDDVAALFESLALRLGSSLLERRLPQAAE